MTSIGNATPLVCVLVLILALVVPPAAQQGGACPPCNCPQNTVSVGVLVGACVAVLVGTLIFEGLAILCYRKYCRNREKPPKVAHRFMVSPNEELVVKENLGYESDSDAHERSLREAKEKKRASIFNISETKDNMMYVPALYRNPISKDRDTGTAIMNGYQDYEPDYGMDNIFTYNAGWGSRVPNILSGKNSNSLESLYMNGDEYPILQTPHGVGPVNFASSKFRDGFGRKSIDIQEDDGEVTTYTYTTGFGGKVRREVATVTTESGDDIEIKGDRVTWRKCKLPDEVVLDIDEEEAKPETRIAIDDNFTIGKPTSTRRQQYTTAEVHSDSPGTSSDPSGNFILRATPSTSRSDSSDDDLYDYGDSLERQQQTLNMSKHSQPGIIGHGTFRATVGGIPLDHGSSEEESPTELFNSRYRYSTGLNKAKLIAMRAAASAHAREGILNEEEPPEDEDQEGSPPVIGFIKLVKSDGSTSTQDGSSEEQYRVMPTRDSDSPRTVRLYPVNSARQPITIQTQLHRGFSQDSYIRHRQETYVEVSDAGVQCEIIPRGGRPGQEKMSILRKDRATYEQEMDSVDDIPTIGVIRLTQPKSSKHVRIIEDQTDYSTMTFSEEDLTSASLEDVTYRSTSRSNERSSPRPRRARSAPARSERVSMPQDNQHPFEEVPTIGVIRLVRPESASDSSGVESEVTSGEESMPEDRLHGQQTDKWTQHEVPIVRLAQQILQESINERTSSQRSLHRSDQDINNIPTIGVVRLVRPQSTARDVRPTTSSRRIERFDDSEVTTRQMSSGVTPVSDMPTIGIIKLLKQESKKEPTSRAPVSVVDRGTHPANTWAQLLREMHGFVESEILRKTSKNQHDQSSDETDSLPRTINVIKLKREEVQAQPLVPYSSMDQSTQRSAEMRDESTMPTFSWSHLIHEVEDQIENRYKRMSAPAPKEEFDATKTVQKLGVIQLKAAPEKIIRDSFTQVSGPHTYEKSTGPAWSFKELVEEVEEEAVQKFKKTLKQVDRSAEPQAFSEPVRSVSVIKLKKEPGQEKLVRDSVTQISGPMTYEKSTGPHRTFADIREEIEEEAVREIKRTLSQLDRPAVVSQDVPQPVRSVSVIKLQKEPEAEKPTLMSRGVQPDLPWREFKEEIEDEAIEEYKKQMRRFKPREAVQQIPETQAPTVSVIKLKGPKSKPAPETWDNITQCDLIEPKPVMADQVTEPARPWSDVLHNVRRILENEYRRTINELETRLTSLPKDEPVVETVPTVAVFKLKGPDVHVQPEAEKPNMIDEKTQAAPHTSEQETAPERPWKNILTDVRKILENEYRRTIRELEDQLSGRDEPDSGKTMAYFKLNAPEVPKVQTVSMYTQIDAPQTGDQGTVPERPWADLLQDVRSSVENEYRVTIRELESQLAERPKDAPKEPKRLGVFKLKGPKAPKAKKPELCDAVTQPAKPWLTMMSEIEEDVERRLSMKKMKPVVVEPEIVQQTQQMVEMAPQMQPATADVTTQASQPTAVSKASQSVTVQKSSMSTEANIKPNVTEQSTSCEVAKSDFFQLFKPESSMQETQASPSKTSKATMPQKTSLQEVGIQTHPSTEDIEVFTDLVSTSDLSVQVEIQSTSDIPTIVPTIMQPVHAPITFKEPDLEKFDFAVQVVPEKTSRASATEQRKSVDNFVQVGSQKPTHKVFGVQVQPDVTDGYSSIVIDMKDAGTDDLQVGSTDKSTEVIVVKELLDCAVQVKPEVKSRVAATDKKKCTDASSQADALIGEMAETLDSSIQAVPNISVSFTSTDTPTSIDAFTQLKPLLIQQGDKFVQVDSNVAEVGTETPVVRYVDNSSQMNTATLSQQIQVQTLQADASTGKELITNETSTQPDIVTKQEVSVQVSMEIETEPAIIKAVVQGEQYSMPTLPTPAEVTDSAMQAMPQSAEFSQQHVPETADKYTERKLDGTSFALQVSQNSTDCSMETVPVVQKTVPIQVRPRTVDKATDCEPKSDGIDIGMQSNIDINEIGISVEPQMVDDSTSVEIKLQLDVGTQADCEITVEPAIIQEVIRAPEESVALINWDVVTSDADTQTVQGETRQQGTSPDGIKTADAVVQHIQLRNLRDGSVQADPDVTTTGTVAFKVDHSVHAIQVKPETADRGMTTVIRGSMERSNMANLIRKAYVKPPSKDVSAQIQPVSNLKTQSTLTDKTEVKGMPVQASPATSTHGQMSRPDVREQWSMTDEVPEEDVIELIVPQIERPVHAPIPILKAELLDKTTQVMSPSKKDMFSSTEVSQTQAATQYDHDSDEMSTQTDAQVDIPVIDTTSQTVPVKRETIGLSTDVTQFRASFTQYEPEQFKSSADTCSTGFSPEKIVLKSTGISPEKLDVRTSATQYQKSIAQDSSMQTEKQEETEVIEETVVLEKIETLKSAPVFSEVKPTMSDVGSQYEASLKSSVAQTIQVKLESKSMSTTGPQLRESVVQYEPERFRTAASSQTTVPTRTTGSSTEKASFKTTGVSPDKVDVKASSTQYQIAVLQDNSMQTEETEEPIPLEEMVTVEQAPVVEFMPEFPSVELVDAGTQAELVTTDKAVLTDKEKQKAMKSSNVQTVKLQLESKFTSAFGPQMKESVVQYEPERFRTAASSQTTVPTRTTGSSTEKASFKTTGVSPDKVDVKASSTQYQIAVLQDNSMQTEETEEPIPLEELVTVEQAPVVEFMPEIPSIELVDAGTQAELVTTDKAVLTDKEKQKAMKSSNVQTVKLQLESKFTSAFGPQMKESVVQYEPERFRTAASSQTTVPTRTTGSSTEKASFKTTGVSPDKVDVKASSTQYQIAVLQDNSMQTEETEEPIPFEELVTVEQAPVVEFMPEFPSAELVDAGTQAELVTTDKAVLTDKEKQKTMKSSNVQTVKLQLESKFTSAFGPQMKESVVQYEPECFRTAASSQTTVPTRTTGSSTEKASFKTTGVSPDKVDVKASSTQYQIAVLQDNSMQTEKTEEPIPFEELVTVEQAPVVEFMPEFPSVELVDAETQAEQITTDRAILTRPESQEKTTSTFVQKYTQASVQNVPKMTSVSQQKTPHRPQLVSEGTTTVKIQLTSIPTQAQPSTRSFGQMVEPTVSDHWSMTDEEPVEEMIVPYVEPVVESMPELPVETHDANVQTTVPTRTTGSSTEKASFKTTGVSPDKVDVKASSTQYQIAVQQDNSMQTEETEEPIRFEELVTVEQAPVVEFMPEVPSVELVDAETQAKQITTDRAILTRPESQEKKTSTFVQKYTQASVQNVPKMTSVSQQKTMHRPQLVSEGTTTVKIQLTSIPTQAQPSTRSFGQMVEPTVSDHWSMTDEEQVEEMIVPHVEPVVERMPELPVETQDANVQVEPTTSHIGIETHPETAEQGSLVLPETREVPSQMSIHQATVSAQATVKHSTTYSQTDQEKKRMKHSAVQTQQHLVTSTSYVPLKEKSYKSVEHRGDLVGIKPRGPVTTEHKSMQASVSTVTSMSQSTSPDQTATAFQTEELVEVNDMEVQTNPVTIIDFVPVLKDSTVQYEPVYFYSASTQAEVPTMDQHVAAIVQNRNQETTTPAINVQPSSSQTEARKGDDNSSQTDPMPEPESLIAPMKIEPVLFAPPPLLPETQVAESQTTNVVSTDRSTSMKLPRLLNSYAQVCPKMQDTNTMTSVKQYTPVAVQNEPETLSQMMQTSPDVREGTTLTESPNITNQSSQHDTAYMHASSQASPESYDATTSFDLVVRELIEAGTQHIMESNNLETQTHTDTCDQASFVELEMQESDCQTELTIEDLEEMLATLKQKLDEKPMVHEFIIPQQLNPVEAPPSFPIETEDSGIQTFLETVQRSTSPILQEVKHAITQYEAELKELGVQVKPDVIDKEMETFIVKVHDAAIQYVSLYGKDKPTQISPAEPETLSQMMQASPKVREGTTLTERPNITDQSSQHDTAYMHTSSQASPESYDATTSFDLVVREMIEAGTQHIMESNNLETQTHMDTCDQASFVELEMQESDCQTELTIEEMIATYKEDLDEKPMVQEFIIPQQLNPVEAPPSFPIETEDSGIQTFLETVQRSTSPILQEVKHAITQYEAKLKELGVQVKPDVIDKEMETFIVKVHDAAIQYVSLYGKDKPTQISPAEPETLSQMMQASPDVREGTTLTERPNITNQSSQHDTAYMHTSSQASPESYDATTSFDLVVREMIETGTQQIIESNNLETQTHTDTSDQASSVEPEVQESDCQTELTIEDLEEMLATLKQKLDEKPMVQEFIIPQQLNPVEAPPTFPIETEDSGIQTFLETVQRSTSPILQEVKHAITQYEAELKELGVQVKPDVIDKEMETFIVKVHDAAIQYVSLYGKDKPTQFSPAVNDTGSLTDQKEYQHSYTSTKSIPLSSKAMEAHPQIIDKATTPMLQQCEKRATQTSPTETVTRWTQREILLADAPIQVRPILDDATSQTDAVIQEDIQAILEPIHKQEVRLEMRSFKETSAVEVQTDPVIIKSAGPDEENESWLDSGIDTDVQTDPVVILSDLDSEIELMDEDSQTFPIDTMDVDVQVESRKEVTDTTSQTSRQPQVAKTVQTMPKLVSYAGTVTATPIVRPISSQTVPTKTATKGFQFEPVPYLTNEDIDTQTPATQTKEQGTHALENKVETSTTQTEEMPVIEPEIIYMDNIQPVEAPLTFSAPEAEVTDIGVQTRTEVTDEDSQTTRVFTTDRPSSPGISYAAAGSQTLPPASRARHTQYEPNATQKKTQTETAVTVNTGTATYRTISQDICLQTFLETKPEIVDRSMQHAALVHTGYSQTEETQLLHDETQTDEVEEEIQFITPSPEFLEAFTQTTTKISDVAAQTEGPHAVQSGTDAPVTKLQVGVSQTPKQSTWSEGTVTEALKSVAIAVQTDAIPVRVVDELITPVHLQPVHAPLKLPEYKPKLLDASIQADVKTDESSMQHDSENTQFNIYSTRVVKGEVKPTVLSEFSMVPQKKHFISHLESSAYPKEEKLPYKHFVHKNTQVKPDVDDLPVQVQPVLDDRSTATEEPISINTEVQTDFAEEPVKEVIRVSQVPLQQTPFLDLGPILMDTGTQVKPKTTDHGMSAIEQKPDRPMLLDTAAQHESYIENAFSQTSTYQQEKSTHISIDVRQEGSQATTEKKNSGVQAKTPKHLAHVLTQAKPDVGDMPIQVQPIQDDQSTATEEPIFNSIEIQTESAQEPFEEVIRVSQVPELQTPFLDLGPILIDTGTQAEPNTNDQGMSAIAPGPVLRDATAQHEVYLENAVSQTIIDQQERGTHTSIDVRQESSQATTQKRDAGVQAKTKREVSLMTSGIQTVVIHEEKPQMMDMAMQFRPLNTDQATLTSQVRTTSSHSNTEPVNMRQAMVQVAIKPETEARGTLTAPKLSRNITTQAETRSYDASVQHDDLPDLADKGLQIKPVMVDDTSETIKSRYVERPTQVDMDWMKPVTTDVSVQNTKEKDMRDKISQVKPISTEVGLSTEVVTKDKGNQADFAPVVDEVIHPDVTEIQHAPIPFPEIMTIDRSIQHQPTVNIQTVQTSIVATERASSPVGPDYSDVSSQTRTDTSDMGLQTNFQDTSTAGVQAVMSYFSEESYKMESVEEDLISAQVVTEEQHMGPAPTVQYQDAEMQYNPITEDSTTETVSTGIDFANQSQPLTIEQETVTDITKLSQAEVQVDIGSVSVITRETAVQHEMVFKPVDVFTQIQPLTVEEGTSTVPLKKSEVSVQYIAPSDKRPSSPRIVQQTTDKGTSAECVTSQSATQTILLKSEVGIQSKPNTKSELTHAAIKPESHDQATATKPDVHASQTQTSFPNKSEGSQCDSTTLVHNTSQYERMFVEDNSVQVKPVIREQANSPIFKRKEVGNASSQTDAVTEDIDSSIEDLIKSAPYQPFTPQADSDFMHDYSDRLCEYLDRDEQTPVYVEHPIERIKESSQFAPRQESSSPVWDYAGDFSSRLYDTEMTESIDIIDSLFTSEQNTFEFEETITKDKTQQEQSAPKYYIESAVQTGPMQFKERSTSPLFPQTKEAQSQFDKDIGHRDTNVQASPITTSESSYTTPMFNQDVSTQADFDIEEVATSDAATQHYVLGREISAQVEPLMTDASMTYRVDSMPTSTQAKPDTLEQGTATLKQSTLTSNMQTQVKPDAVAKTTSPLAIRKNQMAVQTKVDQCHMQTQYDRVRSADAVIQMSPQSVEKGTSTKPENRDVSIHVVPTQCHETTQYEQSIKTRDFMAQYRAQHLDISTQSIDFKVPCLDRASSPVNVAPEKIQKDASPITESPIQPVMVQQVSAAPTQLQPFSQVGNKELRQEIQNEIRMEVIHELREEIRREVQQELQKSQMPVQTKIRQRHIPTQCDMVRSVDATVQMRPQSLEKGTSNKPENRDVSIHVIPSQRHETTQYEQSIKTRDFMAQYRAQHLDSSTQCIDFKVTCLDRASSPISVPHEEIQKHASPIPESPIQPVMIQQVSVAPTQMQPFSQVDNKELHQEIRNELRMEVIHEVRQEICEEIREEIREEVREELLNEVQHEVNSRIETEVRDEIRTELEITVREELREEFIEEYKEEILIDIKEELKVEFESRIRLEFEERTREDLEFKIRREIEPRVRRDLEPIIRRELEQEYIKETIHEVRAEAPVMYQPSEYKAEPIKPLMLDRGTSPAIKKLHDTPTQASTLSKDRSSQYDKPSKPVDGITQTKVNTVECGTTPDKVRTADAPVQAQANMIHRGTTPSEKPNRESGIQAVVQKVDKCDQFEAKPDQSDVSVQCSHDPQTVGFQCQVQPDTIERGTSVEVVKIHQTYIQTENPLLRSENTQTLSEKTDSFCQSEPVFHRDTTLQVKPVTFDKSTSTQPQEMVDYAAQVELLESHETIEKIPVKNQDRSVQYERSMDVTDRRVQAKPVVREQANSPLSFLTFDIISPQRQDPVHAPFYMVQPRDAPKEQAYITEVITGEKAPPVEHTPPMFTSPKSSDPANSNFTYNFSDRPSSTYQARSPLEPLVARLDYVPLKTANVDTFQPTASQISHRTFYESVNESSSQFTRDVLQSMPPRCEMILLQTTAAGTTYTSAFRTSTPTTQLPIPSSYLTRPSILEQVEPTESTPPITSPILPDTESDSLPEMTELEKIRRDLRLSRVIVTDDQATLVGYFVNSDEECQTPDLPVDSPFSTPDHSRVSSRLEYSSSSKFSHTPHSPLRGRQFFMNLEHTPTESIPDIVMEDESFSMPTEEGDWFKRETSAYRLNVPYDKKGSPRPGARIVYSPSQSPSHTPGRMSPVFLSSEDGHRIESLPVPRGMITRLSDLLSDGIPSDDESVLPMSRLSEMIEKHRELNQPPKWSRDPESEVDTTDSDTDTESFSAVMDFTDPFLHENPNFWRGGPSDFTTSSTNSDVSSDDDNVTVYGDCDVYSFDLPFFAPSKPSRSLQDASWMPGEPPRKRHSVVKIDRQRVREELSMSEVVLPDSPPRLTGYRMNMDDGSWQRDRYSNRLSRSEPDLYRSTTSNAPVTSPPSYSTAYPYTRVGSGRLHPAPEQLMVDAASMPALSAEIRYAKLVKKQEISHTQRSQYTRLSHSDPDLASMHEELFDVGHF